MQDHPSPNLPVGELDRAEHTILQLVLQSGHPWPWSVYALGRALGDDLDADDALCALNADGLIHRFGAFVFPTRPAVRFQELQVDG
jgi:hypothetical protein